MGLNAPGHDVAIALSSHVCCQTAMFYTLLVRYFTAALAVLVLYVEAEPVRSRQNWQAG